MLRGRDGGDGAVRVLMDPTQFCVGAGGILSIGAYETIATLAILSVFRNSKANIYLKVNEVAGWICIASSGTTTSS